MVQDTYVQLPGLADKSQCTIGVIADTHLPYRLEALPFQVSSLFKDVDLILHAGDVDDITYLDDLAQLAPLYAVRGNLHFFDLSDGGISLPVDLRLLIAGQRLVVNHGGWPHFGYLASDWFKEKLVDRGREDVNQRIGRRLLRQYPDADVIIFGHSHYHYQAQHGHTLLFNPGGVCRYRSCPTSVGILRLGPDLVEAHVIQLDP